MGLFKSDPAKEPSLSEGFGVVGALAALLGVFADAIADTGPVDQPKEPHWDQGGVYHWRDQQCGYWPD